MRIFKEYYNIKLDLLHMYERYSKYNNLYELDIHRERLEYGGVRVNIIINRII